MKTSSQALTVGKETVCYCTRCKMDLGHTITSMIGGLPARVICRTCKSEHNYKAKKGIKDPGAAPPPSASTRSASPKTPREPKAEPGIPIELEWMKQMNASTKSVRSYAANEAFAPGDRVAHPSFGEGIVQKLIFPNKAEILFRADLKTLIHAGKPA